MAAKYYVIKLTNAVRLATLRLHQNGGLRINFGVSVHANAFSRRPLTMRLSRPKLRMAVANEKEKWLRCVTLFQGQSLAPGPHGCLGTAGVALDRVYCLLSLALKHEESSFGTHWRMSTLGLTVKSVRTEGEAGSS